MTVKDLLKQLSYNEMVVIIAGDKIITDGFAERLKFRADESFWGSKEVVYNMKVGNDYVIKID